MPTFEIFEDEAGEFRWRLRADNGEIVASSEGYGSRSDAERGAQDVRELSADAEVGQGEI